MRVDHGGGAYYAGRPISFDDNIVALTWDSSLQDGY
jgi:hypothetical protein